MLRAVCCVYIVPTSQVTLQSRDLKVKLKVKLKYLDLRGRKFANKEVLSNILGEMKGDREMEIVAMERLIAAKIAESNKNFEELSAMKDWKIVGEIEDDRELEVEKMEEVQAARIAEREAHKRNLETYNVTKNWKLQHKQFS